MSPTIRLHTIWILVIAALVLAPIQDSVSAQGEAVELQLRLSKGEALYYSADASVQALIEIGSVRQSSDVQVQAREVHRVMDVDPAGAALVEVVLEDMRVTADGKAEETLDKPVLLRVGRDGKVIDRGAGDPEDFPAALPNGPVTVGGSWSRPIPFEELGVTGNGTITFTLAGIDQTASGRVARIRFRSQGTVTGTGTPLPPGARTRGTVRGSGELEWSVDQGRLLRVANDLTAETAFEFTAQGQTVQGRIVIRVRQSSTPLAASGVTIPAVPPEFLVSPGKGIGVITLDLAVADVTGRLGAPTARDTGSLYASPSVQWPNGMAGFSDPSDPSKLIGLEVGDRRYRTEKGIGFGSSKGAVLLTYGMSPAQVEVQIPNIGGVTLLIYDDQGIAFPITSDEAHARRGPDHAPVGAVDWIIVFPPGSAAKVLRTP